MVKNLNELSSGAHSLEKVFGWKKRVGVRPTEEPRYIYFAVSDLISNGATRDVAIEIIAANVGKSERYVRTVFYKHYNALKSDPDYSYNLLPPA